MKALAAFAEGPAGAAFVLLCLPLEYLALSLRPGGKKGAGVALDRAFALLPGGFLVLALIAAETLGRSPAVPVCLLLALAGHLLDMRRRRL